VARALGDVLHHFDPRLGVAPGGPPEMLAATRSLAVAAVPLAPGDLLRAGAVWNLAVEMARLGAPGLVLAPAGDFVAGLDDGPGPLGTRLERLAGEDLGRAARERAAACAAATPGLALACLPEAGFERNFASHLEWALLLSAPDAPGLAEAERRALRVLAVRPDARVGITIHGARSLGEARDAFERLARAVEHQHPCGLASYGLLVDDLALYRAIVERRPVGLARPQSPAARALADVARLLLADAREEPR